jgi:hypothetical protein
MCIIYWLQPEFMERNTALHKGEQTVERIDNIKVTEYHPKKKGRKPRTEDELEIVEDYREHGNKTRLAFDYKASHRTISRIVNKHVPKEEQKEIFLRMR